jgi:hypothetical protein
VGAVNRALRQGRPGTGRLHRSGTEAAVTGRTAVAAVTARGHRAGAWGTAVRRLPDGGASLARRAPGAAPGPPGAIGTARGTGHAFDPDA